MSYPAGQRHGNHLPFAVAGCRREGRALYRAVIASDGGERTKDLALGLALLGFDCLFPPAGAPWFEWALEQGPDVVLLVAEGGALPTGALEQLRQARLPVIVLAYCAGLASVDKNPAIDDFALHPWQADEVAARLRRALWRHRGPAGEALIERGHLVIDESRCEVSVAGRVVALTFKEYELLRFLAKHEGKVFSREALLSKVWRYDYFGGDRTVDVHIRRLRSKIEDASHTFIETVRNIGYRFRVDAP